MRRAAVLAELGRCAEFMSFLFSYYDKDDAMLQGVEEKIQLIEQASRDHGFDLPFWKLEFARSWYNELDCEHSFMEHSGPLYESIVTNGRHNAAMDYGLQFIRDPYILREHRMRPYTYLSRPGR